MATAGSQLVILTLDVSDWITDQRKRKHKSSRKAKSKTYSDFMAEISPYAPHNEQLIALFKSFSTQLKATNVTINERLPTTAVTRG